MHEKTADMMIQKYEKALSVRREFEELYDEIFEYCLPQRQGFKNYSAGQRRDDKIFDETAVVGIQEFASRLQSGLTPNFARWADFVTGQEVPEEERDDVNNKLDEVTDYVLKYCKHQILPKKYTSALSTWLWVLLYFVSWKVMLLILFVFNLYLCLMLF